ncbi:MAG TPA: hypothetical protein DCS43_10670 [Verrucomicrobia bacterium]|nr:hypothetical protein [Verrucomicrobiota bacterium]
MSAYVTTEDPREASDRLLSLTLELTERCNQDCQHCCINRPAQDASAKTREMDTETVMRVLREAAGLGCKRVCFTGGEPLLRTDFETLYLYARRQGFQVQLFTNATLLTPPLATLMKAVPPLEPIEVTVYGMSARSVETVTRVAGTHTRLQAGVRLLRENQIPFVVKYACLPANRHELDAFEEWGRRLGAIDGIPSLVLFFRLRDRRDDPVRNRMIQSVRISPADGLALLRRHEAAYAESARQFIQRYAGLAAGCGAGRHVCVDAYGHVQPCGALRDPARSLNIYGSDAPAGLTLDEALRAFAAKGCEPPPARCARCFLYGFCEQCPALSWSEHGAYDQPVAYFCDVAHAQARRLGWLKTDESAWESRVPSVAKAVVNTPT